jgi:hypothetical protein
MKLRSTLFALFVAAVTLISASPGAQRAPPGSTPVRIRFAYGATSAVVSGDLNAYSSVSMSCGRQKDS